MTADGRRQTADGRRQTADGKNNFRKKIATKYKGAMGENLAAGVGSVSALKFSGVLVLLPFKRTKKETFFYYLCGKIWKLHGIT